MRYDNFDKPRFDSWSGRLSFAPENWSFQVSHAFIKSPEFLHSREDVNRTTASFIYNKMWNPNKAIFLTGLWGLNSISKNENAILLEAAYNINRLTLYSRYEWIQKSTEELDLEPVLYGNTLFRVNSFTLGFNINIIKISKTWLAFGSHATVYNADKKLNELYGKNPVGFEMYIRVTPDNMTMAD